MGFEQILFYGLAACIILLACLVVFSKNPVHSVIFLILTMVGISGEYLLLNAQFLAIVHIIVYAGAIMVLFLFVLMLLNLDKETEPIKSKLWQYIAIISGFLFMIVLLTTYGQSANLPTSHLTDTSLGDVKKIGLVLFTNYVLPFEISSILFLAAMVGAVLIGSRESKQDKDTIE